jgi:hypothetical protein
VTKLRALLHRRDRPPVARPANRSDLRRPGRRGYRGPGRGEQLVLGAPDRFRGATNQVCGLWPFSAGTGAPLIGVPLGRHLRTAAGATVCCDPISWFQRARLISNPSEFVLGLPGLGKSSVVRRQVLGLHGYGVNPLILGDLKPDYVDLVRTIGGQVIELGPGRGHLNILDPGDARFAAARLAAAADEALLAGDLKRAEWLRQLRRGVLAEAHTRRTTVLAAHMTILRGGVPPTDREEAILGRALHIADERAALRVGVPWAPGADVPVVEDLLEVVRDAPPAVRQVAIDRGNLDRYRDITESLEATLVALSAGDGRFGDTFARHTSTRMRLDRPVVFDVSSVDDSQQDLQAAVLLACWSTGFGAVNIANVLADAGLEPRRHYFVVMDELWRALRAGRGMVDRVDALSRLNRQRGVGVAMVSHTMSDLLALPSAEDRAKARGLVERSGLLLCAGLPESEFELLEGVVRFSRAEKDDLTSWTDPPAWDERAGREAPPPGRGKFLIKVGGRPGIPLRVDMTTVENDLALNDTNKLWHDVSRIGTVADLPALEAAPA